jgi:hypothetical protein
MNSKFNVLSTLLAKLILVPVEVVERWVYLKYQQFV